MPSTQIPNTKQTEERLNSLALRSEGMALSHTVPAIPREDGN